MKTIPTIMIIVFLTVSLAHADTYIKHKIHTDSYYYGGEVTPADDRVIHVWIGEQKAAFIHEHRVVVFDMNEKTLTFVNMDDSTYVETTLPIEWSTLVSEEDLARLQMFPTTGTVEATGEKRNIGGRECEGYKINTWIPYEGTKYNERDAIIWISEDMPFDIGFINDINAHRLKLQNHSAEFLKEIEKMEGYAVMTETDIYIKGFSVKSTSEIVEMAEMKIPADVYSAPGGFTKKEKLSMRDLQGE